jgi:glycosyltransferase involved in cell wall biosynthesis
MLVEAASLGRRRSMKISVLMLTYNLEPFVEQAIQSVLMQQVDFEYELVIGDDCSTDRTPEIIREFYLRRPDVIRPIFRDGNLGSNANFVHTLRACRGDYIALLDGDDYWVSSDKLQKQVNFLDAHPECSMCMHAASVMTSDGTILPEPAVRKAAKVRPLTLEDVIASWTCCTSSAVLRRSAVGDPPSWLAGLRMYDWPLFALAAAHGTVGYIDGVMCVYRVHAAGVWSRLDLREQLKEMNRMFHRLNAHFDFRYDDLVQEACCKRAYSLVEADLLGLGPHWWEESLRRPRSVTADDVARFHARNRAAEAEKRRAAKSGNRARTSGRRADGERAPERREERDAVVAELRARIGAMEASRLWRAASLYWRTRERVRRAFVRRPGG